MCDDAVDGGSGGGGGDVAVCPAVVSNKIDGTG